MNLEENLPKNSLYFLCRSNGWPCVQVGGFKLPQFPGGIAPAFIDVLSLAVRCCSDCVGSFVELSLSVIILFGCFVRVEVYLTQPDGLST